jgi:hypothetical protein
VTRDQPGRGLAPPTVGTFDLVALANFLAKQTKFVVDPVGISGHVEGCQRIQETGGEPPQAAVAQRRVRLLIEKDLQVDAVLSQKVAADVHDAEVEEVVLQRAADQELQRQVIQLLARRTFETGAGRQHLLDHDVARRQGRGQIPIMFGHLNLALGQREPDVMLDQPREELAIGLGCREGHHAYVCRG